MIRTALALAATTAALSAASLAVAESDDPTRGLPQALLCSVQDTLSVVYLTRVNADGSAIYLATPSDFVTVTPEGVVEHRNAAQSDCTGRTVEQLRTAGQTRAFAE